MRTRRTSPFPPGPGRVGLPLPPSGHGRVGPPPGGPPTPPFRPEQHRVGGRTIEAGAPCRRIRNKKEKPSVAERQKRRVRGRTAGAGVASGTRSRGSPRAPAPMLQLPAALRRSRTGVPFRTLILVQATHNGMEVGPPCKALIDTGDSVSSLLKKGVLPEPFHYG